MNAPTPLQGRLLKFFLERVHIEIPSVDTDLFETGALDSLAFVELLLYMEQEFGITVSLEEVEFDTFRSVEKIAEFLTKNVQPDHSA
ncbi:MAG: acyl carrier protein [Nitrospirae bacterium]|nr:MAG: acyl carrier protein [Nitrospirota bacterium]